MRIKYLFHDKLKLEITSILAQSASSNLDNLALQATVNDKTVETPGWTWMSHHKYDIAPFN